MPVMSIQFNGATYWLEVKPGDGGVEQFKEDVRRLLGLAPEQSFDITFECHIPGAGVCVGSASSDAYETALLAHRAAISWPHTHPATCVVVLARPTHVCAVSLDFGNGLPYTVHLQVVDVVRLACQVEWVCKGIVLSFTPCQRAKPMPQ